MTLKMKQLSSPDQKRIIIFMEGAQIPLYLVNEKYLRNIYKKNRKLKARSLKTLLKLNEKFYL